MRALQSLAGVGIWCIGEHAAMGCAQVYEFLHLFSGDYSFVKAECGKPIPWSQTYFVSIAYTIALIIPFLAMTVIMTAMSQIAKARKSPRISEEFRQGGHRSGQATFYKDRSVRAVQIAMIFFYLPMTTNSLATFSCVPNSDRSKYFMITHPNEQCYVGDKIAALVVSGIILVGLSLLYPILMLRKLFTSREQIATQPSFNARFDIFYEFYNPKSPYYWIMDYPVLLIVAAGKSVLKPHINYQMAISVIVFALKLIVIIVKRPFVDKLTDFIQAIMAIVSLVAINLNFFARHKIGETDVRTKKFTTTTTTNNKSNIYIYFFQFLHHFFFFFFFFFFF